jgi:hypothetical protein
MHHHRHLANTYRLHTAPACRQGRSALGAGDSLRFRSAFLSLFRNALILISGSAVFVDEIRLFHRQKKRIHIKRRANMRGKRDIRAFFKRFCLLLFPIPPERNPLLFSSLIPGAKRQLLILTCEAIQ